MYFLKDLHVEKAPSLCDSLYHAGLSMIQTQRSISKEILSSRSVRPGAGADKYSK